MTFEEQNGLNAGLNKGIKLKKVLKKVSLKNAVKLVKNGLPIATSLIPVGGPVVSKVVNSKVGKFASKISNSKAVKKAGSVIKTVKNAKRAMQKPAGQKSSFNYLSNSPTSFRQPVAQPVATIAKQSFESEGEFLEQPEITTANTAIPLEPSPIPTETKDNTVLYVVGGLAVAGAIYLAKKS